MSPAEVPRMIAPNASWRAVGDDDDCGGDAAATASVELFGVGDDEEDVTVMVDDRTMYI